MNNVNSLTGIKNDVIDKLLQTHKKEVETMISKQLKDKQQLEMRLKVCSLNYASLQLETRLLC